MATSKAVKIIKKVILPLSITTLLKCQCAAEQYQLFMIFALWYSCVRAYTGVCLCLFSHGTRCAGEVIVIRAECQMSYLCTCKIYLC